MSDEPAKTHFYEATLVTAACHGKWDDKFKTKKIKCNEKVAFVHKKSFHDQLMERTWAPGLTFHSVFETKKPQVP